MDDRFTVFKKLAFSTIIIAMTFLTGCQSQSTKPSDGMIPAQNNDGWPVADPRKEGFDEIFYRAMLQGLNDQTGGFAGVDSMVIARHGNLVFDYWNKTGLDQYDRTYGNRSEEIHSLQSASKSFMAVLIGIAIDEGYIQSVDQSIFEYIPRPVGMFTDFSIKQVLSMSMGKLWNEWAQSYNDPENILNEFNSQDYKDYGERILKLPQMKTPGKGFTYITPSTYLLSQVLESATKQSLKEYFYTKLIKPMQVGKIHMATINGKLNFGDGIFLSTRDAAKLGQLVLNEGSWNGNQLVSSRYINRMLSPVFSVTAFDPEYRTYYGHHWWIFERLFNGERIAIFAAIGNGGQYVVAVPKYDLVVAMTGYNYGRMPLDALNLVWNIIGHLQLNKSQQDNAFTVAPASK